MFAFPTQPQTIGQVLDGGFKLYAQTFKDVLPLAVLSALLSLAVALVMVTGQLDVQSAMFWIVAVVIGLVNFGVLNAILYRLDLGAHNRRSGFGGALQYGFNKMPVAIVGTILYILAIALSLVALVLPFFIFSLTLFFYLPAIVIDGTGPWTAIKRSHRLVWGNWWRTATVLTVPILIFFVAYLAIGIVVGVLAGMGQLGSLQVMQVVVQIVTNVLGVFLTPIFYAVIMAQFYDLKLRKEGGDLAGRIKGG